MFKIADLQKFWHEIKFTTRVEKDEEREFKLDLRFKRVSADDFTRIFGGQTTMIDALEEVVDDWSGPTDADDKPLPCTTANRLALFSVAGMATTALQQYHKALNELKLKN
ncbi:hypothetical protein [Iodobacter fluviatilis]|uniref:Uncharacterized protein n=1 Tax=Iodobacter fluviatilis TaxID=537 RepID=A0A7G3GBP1_9NEIS|nr:hypothetical protein [Iodobacter fluviatilis]QBC44462.1 hypothetical protein C1H71_13590 [Iodobacter fluviatilis]